MGAEPHGGTHLVALTLFVVLGPGASVAKTLGMLLIFVCDTDAVHHPGTQTVTTTRIALQDMRSGGIQCDTLISHRD